MFGDAHAGGSGVIDRPANEERVRLDFLPFVERTVQPYGISIDGIHYYFPLWRSELTTPSTRFRPTRNRRTVSSRRFTALDDE